MKIIVKLFAKAQEIAGSDSVEVEVSEPVEISGVRAGLAQRYPKMQSLVPNLIFAVDEEYADDSTVLQTGATVACFPPVSGG